MTEDLWPITIERAKARPPVTILKQQGAELSKRTGTLVEGAVSSVSSDNPQKFCYAFSIAGPVLGYRYRLFTIEHDVAMYPCHLILDEDVWNELFPTTPDADIKALLAHAARRTTAYGESEFIAILKRVFSSNKTRQIIAGIMAQSEA